VLSRGAAPPARSRHAMAYDSERGAVVMFGGVAGGQRLGDTWELDGTAWTRRAVDTAPEPRGGAAMTFEAPAGRIVMFGGDGDAGSLGDTWAWDGAGWTALAAGASPRARSGAAMAYDIVRRQVVMFGGQRPVDGAVTAAGLLDDTWIWDRGAWTSRTALRTTRPSPRNAYGLVRDAAQDVAVLFGGHTDNERVAGLTSDTWVWDGATWRALDAAPPLPPRIGFALGHDGRHVVMFGGARETRELIEAADATWALIDARWVLQPTDTAPSARAGAAMAYDAARGKLVLFGGDDGTGEGPFDTWEWDGARWAQVAAFGPPPRTGHVMVYDPARACVVLFGGLGPGELSDTWEWDGARWTERVSAGPSPASASFTMAYDPARGLIVHYDGFEVHEWDGTRWSSRTPATLPDVHSRQAMIYDPQRRRVVLPAEGADVWEWDGDDWRRPAPAVPSARAAAAIAYDAARGAAVLFGGSPALNDTWTWQGSVWRRETPAVSPPARLQHAMAFDGARGVIAMFGGYGGPDAGLRADTWEWDGATWSQRFPPASPRARVGHAMVYDAAHRQLLMLGGISSVASSPFDLNGELLAELWTWNGGQWTRLTPERPPPPRTDAAMTYDAARGRVVLFGGRGFDPLGDTWEWDGVHWIDRTPRSDRSPPPRFGHTLIYDPVGRRSVLFGGYGSVGFGDTWAWDGAAWTELVAGSLPARRVFHAMTYDPVHGEAVVFGGAAPDRARLGDTWLVRQADPAGPDEACHAGFDGDGDGKIGCADPDCESVCTGCGDGVCTAVESCRLCPADCGPCRLCGDLLCDPDEACSTCPGDCGPCAG